MNTLIQHTIIQSHAPICAVTFFAILFLQSSLDKIFNRKENYDYLTSVFAQSILKNTVGILFPVITLLEFASGICSAIGAVMLYFNQPLTAKLGIALSGITFLCLFFGQRIAKDYAGAASIAVYFAVYLISALMLF